MQRILTCAAAAALMLSGSAMAQTSPSPAKPSVPAEKMGTPDNAPSTRAPSMTSPSTTGVAPTTTGITWRASQLMGAKVYNTANENIGDINELLLEDSGKITQVVIGVGGFLGMGERNIAVKFDELKFTREKNNAVRISTTYTKESLKNLPVWRPDTVMSN